MSRLFLLSLVAILPLAASCERIPPSVSIPDYDKKKAAEHKGEAKPLGSAENPPTYFPADSSQ